MFAVIGKQKYWDFALAVKRFEITTSVHEMTTSEIEVKLARLRENMTWWSNCQILYHSRILNIFYQMLHEIVDDSELSSSLYTYIQRCLQTDSKHNIYLRNVFVIYNVLSYNLLLFCWSELISKMLWKSSCHVFCMTTKCLEFVLLSSINTAR